jgi:serine/threonine-protein kinase
VFRAIVSSAAARSDKLDLVQQEHPGPRVEGESIFPAFAPTQVIDPPPAGEARAEERPAGDSVPSDSVPTDAAPLDGAIDPAAEANAEPHDVAAQPTLSHIGRYALKQRLAEGGLGTVYEAWDPLLSRTVAVKTLQFDLDPPTRVALDGLILNEARTAASLNHRYIVTIYDAGLSAHGVYIAMERLVGRDLRDALDNGWLPPPVRAAQLMRRAADALAYAHARGVVHCDIKPANIFLTRSNRPKVLDFGIARAAHRADKHMLDGLIAGSPYYLAPEQLQGREVDARTDVYSLGVVLYELLTGRKAFDGLSLEEIATAVLTATPPPPHEIAPSVSPELSAITARAMARRPADRYASAAEFAQDLRRFHVQHGQPATMTMQAIVVPSKPKRTMRGWLIAAMALVFGGFVAVAAWQQSTPPPAPAGSAEPQAAPAIAPVVGPAAAPAASAALPPASAPAVQSVQPDVAAPAAAEGATAGATGTPATTAAPAPAAGAIPADRARAAERPARAPARPPRSAGPEPISTPGQTAAAVTGVVQLAISPWGQVEVNGAAAGVAPPLTRLTLPAGTHTITVRNEDFAPLTMTVTVTPEKPVTVRHRFGS